LVASPARAELKIGVVDYGRLVQESPQYKAAQESLRNEFTPRQRELQGQQTTLKAKEDKLNKDKATMTPDQLSVADRELREGVRDFQRKQNEVQEDLNTRQNEEMSRIQKALIEQVRAYAKSQNFDLIIADGVIYTTPTIDITPALLAQLQASPGSAVRPKPAASAPIAPAPAKPPGK